MSGYRTLRVCSGGGGIEAIPEDPRSLDLARIRQTLVDSGLEVVDARVMLIVRTEPEVTVSRTGRLLFKTDKTEEAERLFQRLEPLLAPARDSR